MGHAMRSRREGWRIELAGIFAGGSYLLGDTP